MDGVPVVQPMAARVWTVATVATVVGVTALVAWWLLGIAGNAPATNVVAAQLDAARIALAAGGGAGAGIGLLVAFRRQRHNEIATQLTDRDAAERRTVDLYVKAIDQLGSDKPDVRLGGIYALERIAHTSRTDHPSVIEVLSAFIRVHANTPCDDASLRRGMTIAEGQARAGSEEIRAATISIARRNADYDLPGTWLDIPGADAHSAHIPRVDLSGANLSGANLANADLSGANLANADLSRARLLGANLSGANLSGVVLRGADLTEADLHDVSLRTAAVVDADLTEADLSGADLSGMQLINARLTRLKGARLVGTDLFGADLSKADLTGANLSGANLTAADLSRADLSHANLSDASLADSDLTEANLWGANLLGADLAGAKRAQFRSGAYGISSETFPFTVGDQGVLDRPSLDRLLPHCQG